MAAATPTTAAATPIINPSPSPSELGRGGFEPAGGVVGGGGSGADFAPCMSLDAFLTKYVSEDNASFGAILVKHNEKRLVKAKCVRNLTLTLFKPQPCAILTLTLSPNPTLALTLTLDPIQTPTLRNPHPDPAPLLPS